jgi:hypothetical protein
MFEEFNFLINDELIHLLFTNYIKCPESMINFALTHKHYYYNIFTKYHYEITKDIMPFKIIPNTWLEKYFSKKKASKNECTYYILNWRTCDYISIGHVMTKNYKLAAQCYNGHILYGTPIYVRTNGNQFIYQPKAGDKLLSGCNNDEYARKCLMEASKFAYKIIQK